MAVLTKIILVFSILFSGPANALEFWDELSAPWKTDAKYIFWGGLGLAIFLKQATPDFVESTQRTWTSEKPLGDSKFGDYMGQGVPNLLYFLGMWSHYYFTKNEGSRGRSVMMFKSSFYSAVFTHTTKFVWQEPRPDNYNQKDSFPSGHTTAAFAFASTVAMEHGVYWGTAGYLLAMYAGLSRINDNKHRINDVIGGAAVGISYGMGLYYHANGAGKSALIVLPTEDLSGVALSFATPL